jgi:hypothetical protein
LATSDRQYSKITKWGVGAAIATQEPGAIAPLPKIQYLDARRISIAELGQKTENLGSIFSQGY